MAEKKYYAVRKGRSTGVFETWKECSSAIYKYPGAVYKSFLTRAEAEAYVAPQVSGLSENAPVAYVDGSFHAKSKKIGYGAVVLYNGTEHRMNGLVEDTSIASMRNVAGEIKGAEAAMHYAVAEGYTELVIYHDYEGVGAWCTGAWAAKQEGTQAYKAFYDSIKAQLKVEFRKVKGHSGDTYNDIADLLAKQAVGQAI